MVKHKDGTNYPTSPDPFIPFFTPIDIPPVEKQHEHNWQLADIEKGKTIYGGMAIGTSVMSYPVGKNPDVARYICECGEQKKVKVKE